MLSLSFIATVLMISASALDGSPACSSGNCASIGKEHVLLQLPTKGLSKSKKGKSVDNAPHVKLEYPNMLQANKLESKGAKPHTELAEQAAEEGFLPDLGGALDKVKKAVPIPLGSDEDHMIKDVLKEKLLDPAKKLVMDQINKLHLPASVKGIEDTIKQHIPENIVSKLFKGSEWKTKVQEILDGKGEVDTPEDAGAEGHNIAEAEEEGEKKGKDTEEQKEVDTPEDAGAEGHNIAEAEDEGKKKGKYTEEKKEVDTPEDAGAEGQNIAEAKDEGENDGKKAEAKLVQIEMLPIGGPKDTKIKDYFLNTVLPNAEKGVANMLDKLPIKAKAEEIEKKVKEALPVEEVKKMIPPEAKPVINKILGWFR